LQSQVWREGIFGGVGLYPGKVRRDSCLNIVSDRIRLIPFFLIRINRLSRRLPLFAASSLEGG
jgi:hypothetical protein